MEKTEEWQVLCKIEQDGVRGPPLPRWLRKHEKKRTTVILADNYLQFWPNGDKCCLVYCRPQYDLWKWNASIRSSHVNIQFFNVVFCLSKLKGIDGVLPLQNAILALARSVRSMTPSSRIFFTNLPPNPEGSPVLQKHHKNFGDELRLALEGVRPKMKKVHLLSIREHMVGSDGRILTPVCKYFRREQTLTALGCMMFREFVLREVGAKPHWFCMEEEEMENKE